MPTLEERAAFATTHLRNKEGRPFSLEGREWVLEEFWRPATSFRLWPANPAVICDDCKGEAGTIVDWSPRHESRSPAHAATGCQGLEIQPIIMTVLALPRREGKTFNTAAFALSDIFLARNKSISYLASAGGQTEQLFYENYELPITSSPRLAKAARIVGSQITVRTTKSFFECVNTAKSVTGRGRTMVIIDEARDVPASVAMALLPSVFANNGVECLRGHVHATGVEGAPKTCSTCGDPLVPWYGRIVIMSSAGVLQGGEHDWFEDLRKQLAEHPDPNAHLFERKDSTNPDVSDVPKGMMDRVFGALEATRHYVEVEVHNTPRRKGEDFLARHEIDAVVDHRLGNAEGSTKPCIGFLDVSKTGELTSLVIIGDDTPEGAEAWSRLVIERIDVWDPKTVPGGAIDENTILPVLDRLLPMFPLLRRLDVDTRGMPWATRLVNIARASRSLGKRVHSFAGKKLERRAGYAFLETKVKTRAIRIPPHKDLLAELREARRQYDADGGMDVHETSRKVRHLDVVESAALACYHIHLETMTKRSSLSQATRPTAAKDLLARLYRPVSKGIGENSF